MWRRKIERHIMSFNDGILQELRDLETAGDLPQRVSNRILLAGIIKNTDMISTLAKRESENGKRIGILERLVASLSALVMALLGWTIFA